MLKLNPFKKNRQLIIKNKLKIDKKPFKDIIYFFIKIKKKQNQQRSCIKMQKSEAKLAD